MVDREAGGALLGPTRQRRPPSLDPRLETAARACGAEPIGVASSGAGPIGSHGPRRIEEKGGVTVVQDPGDAAATAAPLTLKPDHAVPLPPSPGSSSTFRNVSEHEHTPKYSSPFGR